MIGTEGYTVGIVGHGFVGQAIERLFPDAVIFDPAKRLSVKADINACRFAFVCVPTPVGPGGHCDTSIVEEVVSWIESDLIVLRSTVAPGTTDRLRRQFNKRIIFQPEYIGETAAHPLLDHQMQGFAVLGGPIQDTSPVADLYKRVFHSSTHFYFCSALCAELTKYMENAFYATKVAFCNEFFDIARTFGIDYNELRETWLADPRISRDHTFVYSDNRGFSGKCLPKDVSAIIAATQAQGYAPPLLRAVMSINDGFREKDPTYAPFRGLWTGTAKEGT